ncbi:MAG: hypothetical protein LAO51_07320 [Acidobacteriia bacterium]|nr:hypothetical protein [Terriglobia bacterium]
MSRSKLLIALAGCVLSGAAAAAEPSLLPWATYAEGVPSPERATGVRPGARPLRPEEIAGYFAALAAASPRAKVLEYARSREGRPLLALAVSDEATIARLDPFRAEHARLADPRGRRPEDDAPAIGSAKAVAWMAYAIHGDELSSADAAVALAYWLVAGEDERAKALRRDLVVLIDPCENPDGRARFLSMTAAFAHAAPNPDSEDLSHAAVWPYGRGNHYLYDLNRDWISMVEPESRRAAAIATWNPQLMVDSHEMGPDDTYLFAPARAPFNPLKPAYLAGWADRFAADQARALDARGYAYYTGEWNEEFFPGYGSSWASYLGAVGILYEMSGVEGTLVHQRSGTVRTYTETVDHQLTSSIANLETLASHRQELLSQFLAARREAILKGAEGPLKAWILAPGRHPDRADRLAALLRDQGIEVLRAESPVKASGLRDAWTGKTLAADLPAGTWMVPLDQPAEPLARALLDPHVPMEAGFFKEEREWLERGKGSRLYDTTAWSLPLDFGIDAYWTGAKPSGDWRDAKAEEPSGSVARTEPAFGYLFEGTSDRSVAALADLLERGIAARIAEKPFRAGGAAYDRGTVLIKREGNPADLAATLEQVASRWRIAVRAAASAKSEEGPDLGGNYFQPLIPPRAGIWTGNGVSSGSYGSLWRLLDVEVPLRFTGLDLSRFGQVDLARFNVLVFPPAGWREGGYRERVGKDGIERLKRWIEAGGTAIGIGGGADFLADKETGLTQARPRREALDRFPPVVLGPSAETVEAAGFFKASGERAGPTETAKESGKDAAAKIEAAPKLPIPSSPYDVAPLLGPGAKPFAEGFPQGTPAGEKPRDLAAWLKPILPPGKERPEAADLERADERLRRFMPHGALLRVDLDPEVWLDWGVGRDDLAVLLESRDALVAEPPVQVAARFSSIDRLHLGGLLWPEAAGRLAKTAYATREGVGRGQVILFLDDPDYRSWMLGTRRLLLNAILYGPGLGTRWSSPW